ncbi:hypothetical protein OA251_03675 [Prochlorococcus sp. AH-716-P08]|nr:hypothetical protein [Prochlorococcus sp. AH-716-P08]
MPKKAILKILSVFFLEKELRKKMPRLPKIIAEKCSKLPIKIYKKYVLYLFLIKAIIARITNPIAADCLIGPIPTTTIKYGYAIDKAKYLLFN